MFMDKDCSHILTKEVCIKFWQKCPDCACSHKLILYVISPHFNGLIIFSTECSHGLFLDFFNYIENINSFKWDKQCGTATTIDINMKE